MRTILKKTLSFIPILNQKLNRYEELKEIVSQLGYLPGHYYSTVPELNEIIKRRSEIFSNTNILDIDFNYENQIKLLEKFREFYHDYPYFSNKSKDWDLRFRSDPNFFYRYSDAIFLFCTMRCFKPLRIVEIGSGHSSALMLDTNEFFFNNKINLTFIEPNPDDRLNSILKERDKNSHNIICDYIQNINLDVFEALSENDILFIDSSHVSKVGSDLNVILFDIIPKLKSGVLIHFHDIFYPFELPEHWIIKNHIYWNENYLLRAFLMNNNKFEILAFNSYLHKFNRDWFEINMPECLIGDTDTGSIWIRKK